MKKKNFSFIFSIVLLFIVSIYSCTDNWDSHYSPISAEKSDLNLYDYIKSQDSLSIFTKMLKIAGYDTILNKSQTYTVWAPVNSALQNVNLNDSSKVIEIVKNHIARFSYTTSGVSSKQVYMLANKIITFAGSGSTYTFGGQNIIKSNIATTNGILHFVANYVPYLTNIWEFIGKTQGLDSLKSYLYSNSKLEFDLVASGNDIGTDANGQLLYDSVFTFTNKILNRMGALNTEDSVYTVILPNNNAWIESYNRIKPYFNTLNKDGGAAKQRQNTEWAIVQDLVFRKTQNNPGSLDSLVSTNQNVFYQPGYLFDGATKNTVSNGLVYVNSSLKYKATDSWQKEIHIEAENVSFSEVGSKSNFDIFPRTSFGSGLSISKDKYIFAKNTATNNLSPVFVRFPIPNTLSAKYNIYCVFVPASIADKTDMRPSRANFYLSYIDALGTIVKDQKITVTNNETDPTKPTKMFINQFEFPFCNLLDPENIINYVVSVNLKVENAVKTSETVKYNRDIRIDCIILEPVQ